MFFRNRYSVARRWPRHWWNSSVEVFTPAAHVRAIGMNISAGGMGLFAVANLQVGTHIEVEFEYRVGSKRRMHGIVRHRALYLYGIQFTSDLDSGLERASIPVQS